MHICIHPNSVLAFNKSTLPPHFSPSKPSNTPSEDNVAFRFKSGFNSLLAESKIISFEYKSSKALSQFEFITQTTETKKQFLFGMFVRTM